MRQHAAITPYHSSPYLTFSTTHLSRILPFLPNVHFVAPSLLSCMELFSRQVVEKHGPAFKADKNLTLVQRLGHNVLKTGETLTVVLIRLKTLTLIFCHPHMMLLPSFPLTLSSTLLPTCPLFRHLSPSPLPNPFPSHHRPHSVLVLLSQA